MWVCCQSARPWVLSKLLLPHSYHFFPFIFCVPVVSGFPVQPSVGNFLLITYWVIPYIPGILPGITWHPARKQGSRHRGQPTPLILPVVTLWWGWTVWLMKKKRMRSQEEKGAGDIKRHRQWGVMVMCVNSVPKIENPGYLSFLSPWLTDCYW